MNESIIKTLAVAFSVCLVCSLIVSASAVSLRDLQKENKLNDKRLKVLQVAGIYDQNISISDQFNQLESKFIDFDSGMLMAEYNNFNIDDSNFFLKEFIKPHFKIQTIIDKKVDPSRPTKIAGSRLIIMYFCIGFRNGID